MDAVGIILIVAIAIVAIVLILCVALKDKGEESPSDTASKAAGTEKPMPSMASRSEKASSKVEKGAAAKASTAPETSSTLKMPIVPKGSSQAVSEPEDNRREELVTLMNGDYAVTTICEVCGAEKTGGLCSVCGC